jgi:flagellin
MAMNSVNTNAGALVALQNLNSTGRELETVQQRINTGKKVASSKDNGAVWGIAKMQSATANSLNSVKSSLQRGQSMIDVGLAAGDTVTALLDQMRDKVLAAADTSLETAALNALKTDFNSLREQITKAVNNSKFNGRSVVDGQTAKMEFLQNENGDAFTVASATISLVGLGLTSTTTFTTASAAKTMIATMDAALQTAINKLSTLGTYAAGLDSHMSFIGKLQDSLEAGVGNLVDADLAKESARLTALQTKQQLGVQALSIANQSPQMLLSLFRG